MRKNYIDFKHMNTVMSFEDKCKLNGNTYKSKATRVSMILYSMNVHTSQQMLMESLLSLTVL